ncbi:hypothetical protein ACFX1S_035558 [Malus domestica]
MIVDPKGCWGLILDERMMNDGAFFKGRRGLILKERWTKNTFFKGRRGLILDERMMNDGAFFKGRRGLILKERWTKNEE